MHALGPNPQQLLEAVATVAIWTKRIDASTKRDDRQHERALDYEQRVWQTKNDTLRTLISTCRFVKWRAQLTGAENRDESCRRATTIRALYQFRERIGDEDGISEITAYAAEPVRKALDAILEEVNAQRRKHLAALLALQRIDPQLDAAIQEELADDSGGPVGRAVDRLQERTHLLQQQTNALDAISRNSDLDVDAVIALCDHLIDVARTDLRSGYGGMGSA